MQGCCLYWERLYTDTDFHLNLGARSLHRQTFSPLIWVEENVPFTDNGFSLKSGNFPTQTFPLSSNQKFKVRKYIKMYALLKNSCHSFLYDWFLSKKKIIVKQMSHSKRFIVDGYFGFCKWVIINCKFFGIGVI